VLLWARRGEASLILDQFRRADRDAVVMTLLVEVAFVANFALLYVTAFRAAGLPARPDRFLLITTASHVVNILSKTGGLAGIGLFLREARRTGQPAARVVAAYMIVYALSWLSFLLVLVCSLEMLYARGSLQAGEMIAAAVMIGLIVVVGAAIVVASRSERSLERVYLRGVRPLNGIAARLGHSPVAVEASVREHASELYGAVSEVRRNPAHFALPALHAVGVDLFSALMLFAVARALHSGISAETALAAYATSMLFSMVAITPGGLGVVEASLSVVLVSLGVPRHNAVAVALGYRAFEFWLPVAIGSVSLLLLRGSGGATARAGEDDGSIVAA
jgi:uncharacterized protein (TIRG00374 family)